MVARVPTLQKIIIRHGHEDCRATQRTFANSLAVFGTKAVSKPLPVAPSCLVVVENFEILFKVVQDRGEGLFGLLRVVEQE